MNPLYDDKQHCQWSGKENRADAIAWARKTVKETVGI